MISIVVLAAGKSTRFGENKLLAEIDGVSMIRRVVKEALASKADETLVVLGYEAEKIRKALSGLRCKFVLNEEFEIGQSSSVKRGVEEVRDRAEAVLILPGDVALVSSKVTDLVIDEYLRDRDVIVVAAHGKRSGHPILFDRSLFSEIMEIDEESMGLKKITSKYYSKIKRVEAGSDNVLLDVDTREDLARVSRRDQV